MCVVLNCACLGVETVCNVDAHDSDSAISEDEKVRSMIASQSTSTKGPVSPIVEEQIPPTQQIPPPPQPDPAHVRPPKASESVVPIVPPKRFKDPRVVPEKQQHKLGVADLRKHGVIDEGVACSSSILSG